MIRLSSPIIGEEELAAASRVLRSGKIAQGPEVAAFEQEFSAYVGERHCVAVNSGTSALHLGMLALGFGPGDEVIVPSFTFAATANAVRLTGAEPVFVDIEPTSFCMSVDAANAAVTPRTVAILPVHLYGHPADMVGLRRLARAHGLALVEDAAQAHLAGLAGQPVGALGDIAMFSFYPTKNMTTGEGGMVVTPSAQVARAVKLLRNQGMEARYKNEVVGFNARMTDIAGALGRVQLKKLPTWTARRQRNASRLSSALRGVQVPMVAENCIHAFHQYTVRSEQRDLLRAHLTKNGIGSGVYYPAPVHTLPSFDLNLDLPATESAVADVLSLPVHPGLSDSELNTIIAAVNDHVS